MFSQRELLPGIHSGELQIQKLRLNIRAENPEVADRVRFWPNGFSPEASWVCKDHQACFWPMLLNRMWIRSGIFTGNKLTSSCALCLSPGVRSWSTVSWCGRWRSRKRKRRTSSWTSNRRWMLSRSARLHSEKTSRSRQSISRVIYVVDCFDAAWFSIFIVKNEKGVILRDQTQEVAENLHKKTTISCSVFQLNAWAQKRLQRTDRAFPGIFTSIL